MEAPKFQHDCDRCVFLGRMQECDCYLCPDVRVRGLGPTILVRHSDDASDYGSLLVSLVERDWPTHFRDGVPDLFAEAVMLARRQGHTWPPGVPDNLTDWIRSSEDCARLIGDIRMALLYHDDMHDGISTDTPDSEAALYLWSAMGALETAQAQLRLAIRADRREKQNAITGGKAT